MNIQTTSDLFRSKSKKKTTILSLDIFDTIFIRTYAKPVDVFYKVQDEISVRGLFKNWTDRESFKQIRIQAEIDARQDYAHEKGEIGIYEIYTQLMSHPLDLFHEWVTIHDLVQCEFDIETSALKLNDDFLQKLTEYIDYESLIFVSDMYLPSTFLETLIKQKGVTNILGDHSKLYVSNEYRKGKVTGLFDNVLQDFAVKPEEIIHIGDNYYADTQSPQKLGIKAYYYDISSEFIDHIIDKEREISDEFRNFNTDLYKGDDIGLTAMRRRAFSRSQKEALNHYNYGSIILGPLFSGFIDWIVSEVQKNKVNKIYSFTRESYLFNKLLNESCKQKGLDLEIYEIHVSRFFTKLITTDFSSEVEFFKHFKKRANPSLKSILNEFSIELQAYKNLFEFVNEHDSELTDDTLRKVIQSIINDRELFSAIQEHVNNQKKHYKNYLKNLQLENQNVFITDLGYGGTIQKLLQKFMNSEGFNSQIHGLYFFTDYRILDLDYSKNVFSGFIANEGQPFYLRDVFARTPEIIEQACMPDYGSFKGFNSQGDLKFFKQGIEKNQRKEIKQLQSGIESFHKVWLSYKFPKTSKHVDFKALIGYLQLILIRSLRDPTIEEVNLFVDWYHDNNNGSDDCEPFLGTEEVIKKAQEMTREQISELTWLECFWPNGLYTLIESNKQSSKVEEETTPQIPDEEKNIVEFEEVKINMNNQQSSRTSKVRRWLKSLIE